ncbi:MAG: dihydrofolate reductase family protein [Actinobacteria bacterium]|nr:dihydrofolate reductase family protein [Actinomycetota bacterium]MBV8562519.1 dihydrofolate reductase family protein [Actinomycetota bacterium]
MEPLELLEEAPGLPRWELPAELERLYGGPLGFDEPCLVANFVQTLDGVVAIPDVPGSNALVADGSEQDKFLMGLLRACADAIVIGSGTMLASEKGRWRPEGPHPASAELFRELRASRGRPELPEVAVVTTGGSFDPAHPLVQSGALVLTTERAAADIRAAVPPVAEVVAVNEGDAVNLAEAVAVLRGRGHRLILSEAGPHVTGELVASRLVDELFLTVSPLIAGRFADPRLSLVEGVELLPEVRVEGELRSVRRAGSHLMLRYAFPRM